MIDPLGCGPAVALLAGSDDRFRRVEAERFDRAWLGLLVVSVAWGLASIALWHGSYRLCREPAGFYIAPAIAVGLFWLLGLYARSTAALAWFVGRDERSLTQVASAAVVGVLLLLLVVLGPDWHRQEPPLPGWLAWLRPPSKIDRLLLLLPLWGAWSTIILLQFRRPDPRAEPQLAALARGGGPLTAAVLMGLLLAVSVGAFAFLPWAQLAIPAVGIVAAVGGGLLMTWRRGRMDRQVLLAANFLTQMSMLLTYLAVRDPRFW